MLKFARGAALASLVMLASTTMATAQQRWSGVYVGASAGWQWTDYASSLQGFPGNNVNDVFSSGIAGLHVGIQHQMGNLVIGLEGSYSGTGGSGFSDGTNSPTGDCLGASLINPFTCQAKLTSLFMIGPRLGWSPSDQWLLYVTGGWANGHLSDRVLFGGNVVGSTSRPHDGWYFGGGIDFALTRNWSIGVEYTHIDFNTAFHCEIPSLGGCAAGESRNASADTDIVRARLTLTLGRP